MQIFNCVIMVVTLVGALAFCCLGCYIGDHSDNGVSKHDFLLRAMRIIGIMVIVCFAYSMACLSLDGITRQERIANLIGSEAGTVIIGGIMCFLYWLTTHPNFDKRATHG